jgi:hypothetical protein
MSQFCELFIQLSAQVPIFHVVGTEKEDSSETLESSRRVEQEPSNENDPGSVG